MEDNHSNVIVPYWVSRKPKWQLEVWSDDKHKDVFLFLESVGQRRRRFGDWLPRQVAPTLLRDLRDAQKVLAWSSPAPLSWLFRLIRRKAVVFRGCPAYILKLWDPMGDLYGSVTIHPALANKRWILRLARKEARLFIDDLGAAVAMAEQIERGKLL
jgi:hypothetical protein